MVDVESALLSVRERDNWRRRMESLERSLEDVRDQRRKLEVRLRRVRKDLVRLRQANDAMLDLARSTTRPELIHVPTPTAIRNR